MVKGSLLSTETPFEEPLGGEMIPRLSKAKVLCRTKRGKKIAVMCTSEGEATQTLLQGREINLPWEDAGAA